MSGELRIASAPGGTIYANILNASSQRWNGSSFENYQSANYDDYAITATEQGSSGVYVADFPSGISDAGSYEVIFYSRDGASVAEGDPIVGVATIVWDGDSVAVDEDTASGEVSGADWLTYVLRVFKRTDKSDEVFDETNAAIAEIRRRIPTQRDGIERTITDAIGTLGEYKMDLESDFGLPVSDVFLRDASDGRYLNKISKAAFDRKFSIWGTAAAERDIPTDYCVFGSQILVGPVPDSIDYTYVISFTKANVTPVDANSTAIPYTTQDYKEALRAGVLYRLFSGVENDDQAAKNKAIWDSFLEDLEVKERRLREAVGFTAYNDL